MGADGGVSWAELKDPSLYDRVGALTAPFGFWNNNDKNHWVEHHDWENENTWCSPPHYLVGYYGSFMGDWKGSQALDEVLREDSRQQNNLTFSELWMDLITREDWKNGYWTRTSLEKMLWENFHWYSDFDEVVNKFGILQDMLVGDWIKELNQAIVNFGHEETWT